MNIKILLETSLNVEIALPILLTHQPQVKGYIFLKFMF